MGAGLEGRRPLIMAVTGRRERSPADVDVVVAQIEAVAAAGVDLVQIREPGLPDRHLYEVVARSVPRLDGGSTRIVVNDRLDIALAIGGVGVHLRSRSAPGAEVRRWLGPAMPLGRSVHSLAEARAAAAGGGLDYLVWGTVFPSASKPGRPACGPEAIGRARDEISLPILAIGGLTVDNSREVFREGAAGVAAIGLFGGVQEPARLSRVVSELRQRYVESHVQRG